MKIEYHNLYTHFVFTTLHRLPVIVEAVRERIEKITFAEEYDAMLKLSNGLTMELLEVIQGTWLRTFVRMNGSRKVYIPTIR